MELVIFKIEIHGGGGAKSPLTSAGVAGIMRMSELGELEDLATLAVLQFSEYKDNPGRGQITLYQFFCVSRSNG